MTDTAASPDLTATTTDFTTALASFTAAQDAAQAQLVAVNEEIAALEADKRRITAAAPHTSDIVAAFVRGIRSAAGQFERDLAAHLGREFGGADGRAARAVAGSPLILDGHMMEADREAVAERRMRGDASSLDLNALAFFMRGPIEAEIPALVDRLFPKAKTGMTAADRREALRVINEQLDALQARAAEMQAQLSAARAAINGRR